MVNSRNASRTEMAVESLRNMITSRDLKPGDPVAIEADLEKELQISRVILREAISRLRGLGILDSRQGVGLIVGKPDPVALFRQGIAGSVLDEFDLSQLSELRYVLEVGAVELSVNRATEEQLTRLTQLADQFKKVAQGEMEEASLDEIEIALHTTILEASQNPMLIQMHQVLVVYFAKIAASIDGYLPDQTEEKVIWEHFAIAEAFAGRNVERARAQLSSHLADLISDHDTTDSAGKPLSMHDIHDANMGNNP